MTRKQRWPPCSSKGKLFYLFPLKESKGSPGTQRHRDGRKETATGERCLLEPRESSTHLQRTLARNAGQKQTATGNIEQPSKVRRETISLNVSLLWQGHAMLSRPGLNSQFPVSVDECWDYPCASP